MQDYETEEQQIEAIKNWWKENSTSLILGLSLGVGGLGGWNYYNTSQHNHSVEASDIYITMMQNLDAGSDVSAAEDNLIATYSDTPYAAMAALATASDMYKKGQLDDAIAKLQWVNAHANEEEILQTARLRLARLFIEQKKYDEAESWLMTDYPAAFTVLYEELKGDLFAIKGDKVQARVAYDKAIDKAGASSPLLQIKRRELGDNTLDSDQQDPAA